MSKKLYKPFDLQIVLEYYEQMSKVVDYVFPKKVTWDNALDIDINYFSDYKHPQWLRDYFPLNVLYYKEKTGKLRPFKNPRTKYQNYYNLVSTVILTPDAWGFYYRKNKHKGYGNVVFAVSAYETHVQSIYADRQPVIKHNSFVEFANKLYPKDLELIEHCRIMDHRYPCKDVEKLINKELELNI